MTITHQTVIGDNGKPSAVIIPWDVFQKVRGMLEGEATPEEAEKLCRRPRLTASMATLKHLPI